MKRICRAVRGFCALGTVAAVLAVSSTASLAENTSALSSRQSLGRSLFNDMRLSADASTSCATCHLPDKAFTDRRRTALGIGAKIGTRNTPSLLNAAAHDSFSWDGRRDSLESQVLAPFTNSREHGFKNLDEVTKRIAANPSYREQFARAFEDQQVSAPNIAAALAAYVRSVAGGPSRFDRYWFNGDKAALTEFERRGFEIFRGAGQCVVCHGISDDRAAFTDNRFHSLGVGAAKLHDRLAESATRALSATQVPGGHPNSPICGRVKLPHPEHT